LWYLFIREVNTCLYKSPGSNKQSPPSFRLIAQFTTGNASGKLSLNFGLRFQKISQTLDFGKIHAAIQECTLRELPGFRPPQPHPQQGARDPLHTNRSTMKMKFNNFFAGKAAPFFKPKYKRAIYGFITNSNITQLSIPWPHQRPGKFLRYGARIISTKTNNRDPPPSGRGGLGKNQIHDDLVRRSS